ncbi:iron dicitrate transport regulator FecR, partial [Achromobacter xylosoxidans]
YRSGWIDCAPEVAHLPISGAFPLEDTDRVLATVADTLPLRLRYRTRYWVSVLPRGASGTNL